ncbi:sensor histidine kinase [Mastigocoleus testarum]|nr:ATP-binding protein [Mastigocoleus testarum]
MKSIKSSLLSGNRLKISWMNSQAENIFQKNSYSWFQRIIDKTKIGHKITIGYGITIGIAAMGITVGLFVGDVYWKQPALKQQEISHRESALLMQLKDSLLETKSQFIPYITNPHLLENYSSYLLIHSDKIIAVLSELENEISHENQGLQRQNLADLQNFIQKHKDTTQTYRKKLVTTINKFNIINSDNQTIDTRNSRNLLVNFLESLEALQLEKDIQELNKLIAFAEDKKRAANTNLNLAIQLQADITKYSILLSVAIAIFLAFFTTWLITYPLTAVTKVAQKVANESNFDLIVPVTTKDEVGLLASSFNQMIQTVSKYIHELELARQTLEQRVEERTQELSQALQNLQQTQSQLIQTEKMSSLGQMVAGVAHEINNPVNFIYGNIRHVNSYVDDLLALLKLYQEEHIDVSPKILEEIENIDLEFVTDDLPKTLSSMKIGAQRIRDIVLSLRNFSRLDEAEAKAIDIHEGIESTLLLLNHQIKKGIEVVRQYGDLMLVECYPAQLNQVFMNILNNGMDALQEQPEEFSKQIRIQTEVLETKVNKSVRIRIKDNGPGIPLNIQEKLFDPFFTTKPIGKGTGLGLSISYSIVKKHKGEIEVISEPGKGTEFIIMLPTLMNQENYL